MDEPDADGRDPAAAESEVALLRRIGDGDRAAFHALFGAYYRRLTRFCSRLVADPQLVEEIVNDTMMVIWRKADSFEARSRISTWIFGIAYRLAMKALASRRSHAKVIEYQGEIQCEAAQAGDTEERELLEAALRQLSPEHRAVLELTYFMGYSCAEIATIVKCPVNTVKTRLFHARGRLRTLWPVPSRDPQSTFLETME